MPASSGSRMSDLAKLRALDARERRLLAAAAGLLPVVAVALKAISLRRTAALLRRLEPGRVGPPLNPAAIARLTAIAARRVAPGASCIVRSLVLQTLLARHGHAAEIRFGARKHGRRLMAHAWVECEGRALLEGVGDAYPPFSRAPRG